MCGKLFVRGRMSLDGNKLQKGIQKKRSLLTMMSIIEMRVLIDGKQTAGCS